MSSKGSLDLDISLLGSKAPFFLSPWRRDVEERGQLEVRGHPQGKNEPWQLGLRSRREPLCLGRGELSLLKTGQIEMTSG